MSNEDDTIKCPSCKNTVSITYTFCPYCGYDLRPLIRFKARKEIDFKRILLYRIRWLMFKPDQIFKEINLTPDLIGPFLIIAFSALMITFRLALVLGTNILNPMVFLFSYLVALLVLFFFLIFYSFLVYIFVKLAGGSGNYSTTVSIFGYSLLPAALGVIIVDIYLATTGLSNRLGNSNFLVELFNTGAMIQSFFLLASAFYFAYGLIYTHGLNKYSAFIVSYISFGLLAAIILSF